MLMTKAVLCKVLINGLLAIYICKMDVAMLFSMLALVTMIVIAITYHNDK